MNENINPETKTLFQGTIENIVEDINGALSNSFTKGLAYGLFSGLSVPYLGTSAKRVIEEGFSDDNLADNPFFTLTLVSSAFFSIAATIPLAQATDNKSLLAIPILQVADYLGHKVCDVYKARKNHE